MVKITNLEFLRVAGGRRSPLGDSRIDLPTTPSVSIVKVDTDEGVSGISFTAGLTGFGAPANVVPLKDIVLGTDPFAVSRTWNKMVHGWRKPFYAGEMIATISGVDLAIWDLVGKLLDVPLYRMWGGSDQRVPVYAAGGLYGSSDDGDILAAEMRGYIAAGHTAVKMKVGRLDLGSDMSRVCEVREAVGPDVKLMVDANGAWTRAEANRFIQAADDLDLFWVEEPLHWTHTHDYSRLRDRSSVPIAAGENTATRYGAKPLLVEGAVDILQTDAAIGGGATEWLRIAALASAFDVPMAPHGDASIHAQLFGGISNGLILEFDMDQHARIGQFMDVPAVVDGALELRDSPGLGIGFDWDYVAANTLEKF
jgi:D-arabinonate dehydratase